MCLSLTHVPIPNTCTTTLSLNHLIKDLVSLSEDDLVVGPVVHLVARNKSDNPGVSHAAMTLADIHSNLVLSGMEMATTVKG